MKKKQETKPHSYDENKKVSKAFGYQGSQQNPWLDGGKKWVSLYNESTEKADKEMTDIRALYEYFTITFTEDELTRFCQILIELFAGVLKQDYNTIFERSQALESHVGSCIAAHIAVDMLAPNDCGEWK